MPDNTDENNDDSQNSGNSNEGFDLEKLDADTKKAVQALAEKMAEEKLKPIKQKLDEAYGKRDEVLKRNKELEELKKAEELRRLEEQGKKEEALALRLKQAEEEKDILKKQNLELSRDMSLRNALNTHEFRNDNAREMAFRELVSNLVRNEQDVWVAKDGRPIADLVQAFVSNEDNAFLLKQKISSGSGTNTGGKSADDGGKKGSLFTMKQEDVLKLAAEGKLNKR
jgi:hypothetical protein